MPQMSKKALIVDDSNIILIENIILGEGIDGITVFKELKQKK